MNLVELIRKKRDGFALSRHELAHIVTGYVRGEIPDYQMSAFLMAVYFRGMDAEESAALTEVMLRSGRVLDLSSIPGPKVDKHSTGGVGDKVSIILAPVVASCGVIVPMISGRGLGHTGGTLDKLESIPGFRTHLSVAEVLGVLKATGFVLIGQSDEIVPADRKLYALRDVTATIESFPLIAGSIMSKKLAEGIDALVLDVKTGSGAFMGTHQRAVDLARLLVGVGEDAGKRTLAFVTGMDQPLGNAVGNWLEVVESVECLRGKNVPDVMELVTVLGGAMVHLGGRAKTIEDGMRLCHKAIWSGSAYESFLRLVRAQGGDITVLEDPQLYGSSPFTIDLKSHAAGYVGAFDTWRIGELAVGLGTGRASVDDVIDPRAGFTFSKKLGDCVEEGETIATVHASRESLAAAAEQELRRCIAITENPPAPAPLIRSVVDRTGESAWTTPRVY